jgi:hypothetical protein
VRGLAEDLALRAAIMAAYQFADEAKRERGKGRTEPGPRA